MLRRIVGVLVALATIASCGQESGIRVSDAWIRGGPPGLQVMAGYMTVTNVSDAPRKLIGAESTLFREVEIHRSFIEAGLAKMEAVEGIAIPGRQRIVLEPTGYHLMLMRPTRAVHPGEQVPVILRFEGGTRLDAAFEVR